MTDKPLISVIMPSYNSERFIGKAIESVINQTYLNWELLIIDGFSSDKTREIVAEYAKSNQRVRLIDNENDQGPSQARSVGILASQGEYIAFIDSDDLWLPEKLVIQLDFLTSNDVRFCFTQFKKISECGIITELAMGIHTSNTYRQYLRRRGISNSSVLIHRDCMTKKIVNTYGKYHGEDTLWWLLIMKNGVTAHGIRRPLIYYRTVDNSLSTKITKNQLTVWHSYRNELSLGRLEAAHYYFWYVMDVLFRRMIYKLKALTL